MSLLKKYLDKQPTQPKPKEQGKPDTTKLRCVFGQYFTDGNSCMGFFIEMRSLTDRFATTKL